MMPVEGQLVSACPDDVTVCHAVEEDLIEQEWVNVGSTLNLRFP
jgi:hypothetical protein